MATSPGERAVYCSANPNLALGAVGKTMNESPMSIFDRLIGEPMKIREYGWAFDPAGQPYGGGGVWMLPRDFMKFGQLMLNGGVWEGRRILSQDFVERASSRLYHMRNLYYGYLWWSIDYPFKDRLVRAYYAAGNGGQFVAVVPELELVVATYGGNYARLATWLDLMPQMLLPAVREPGDNLNAPVIPVEFKSPYGRSEAAGPVTAEEAASLSARDHVADGERPK
jgi:CubicO group peptidase (beta-lactamase class C family)